MTKAVKVDTWYYTHKAISGVPEDVGDDEAPPKKPVVEERKVTIEIRLIKEIRETETAPYSVSKVSFEATCKEFDIRITGTDIEAIRLAVWSRLDDRLKIVWKNYLLVEVDRPFTYGGNTGNGVSVIWRNVEKGVAWNGAELMREYSTYGRPGADRYIISPWPAAFVQKNGRVIACIEETPANLSGLETFTQKMDDFRKVIGKFLSPELIHQTLTGVAGLTLLSAPESTPEPEICLLQDG